jgi:uncharacterized BrkB/YihY/UPF0761 family membrane protein
MTFSKIGDGKTRPETTNALKRQLIFLSITFAIVYVIILILPGLTAGPVDWLLERWHGVKFVEGWTPGLTVYATLLIVLPAVYVILVIALFLVNRKRRTS